MKAKAPPSPSQLDSFASDGPDGSDGLSQGDTAYERPLQEVHSYLTRFMILDPDTAVVIATWVVASWSSELWDCFPHLSISSPEKRCGKTNLLELLSVICPRAKLTSNLSSAALFRLVDAQRPTLLIDEAQFLSRRGSEKVEEIRELICGSYRRKSAIATRCDTRKGANFKPQEFKTYCPKAFAYIGRLDSVVDDRCLIVFLRRKKDDEFTERFLESNWRPSGQKIHDMLKEWSKSGKDDLKDIYPRVKPLDIENARLADLMVPLQTVLHRMCDVDALSVIERYARDLESREAEIERQSPGVKLLLALRDIFAGRPESRFLETTYILHTLKGRIEEPWYKLNKGEGINDLTLANLLRPYDIGPVSNGKARGYKKAHFRETWERYCG